MKYFKLSTVAAAALAGTLGSAQAYDFTAGNVTLSIYGVLDGSIYTMHSAQPVPGVSSATSYGWASNNGATSRLGFRVSKDLGDGLKIGGNLEQELEFATGGSGDGASIATQAVIGGQTGQFNRAANMFLSGTSWGELRLGRQYSPSLGLAFASDVLGVNSGGYANMWVFSNLLNGFLVSGHGGEGNININGGTDSPDIFVDGLGYTSPTFSGMQVKVFQSIGSNLQPVTAKGNAGQPFNDSGITDLTVTYSDGALSLGVGDQLVRVGNGTAGTYTGQDVNDVQVTGSYKFGATKLTASYGGVSYAGGYKAALGAGAPDNLRIYTLGGTQMLTDKIRLGLSYTDAQDTDNTSNGVRLIAAQVDYALAADSDLYVQLSSSDNKGGANVSGMYGSTLPAAVGSGASGNVTALFAGARYKF